MCRGRDSMTGVPSSHVCVRVRVYRGVRLCVCSCVRLHMHVTMCGCVYGSVVVCVQLCGCVYACVCGCVCSCVYVTPPGYVRQHACPGSLPSSREDPRDCGLRSRRLSHQLRAAEARSSKSRCGLPWRPWRVHPRPPAWPAAGSALLGLQTQPSAACLPMHSGSSYRNTGHGVRARTCDLILT